MKTNKAPQALENDFLVAHVSHRVYQTNRIESKFDEVAFAGGSVQVVTNELFAVLNFLFSSLVDHWVGCLDVVVNYVVWKDTTLALRKEEEREFFILVVVVEASLRVINVED